VLDLHPDSWTMANGLDKLNESQFSDSQFLMT
jgi:hypothetical protein